MNPKNLARKHVENRTAAPAVHLFDAPDVERGPSRPWRTLDQGDDPNVAVFEFDPGRADAAEDLAGELGAQFIEGATRVEDLSDRVNTVEVAFEADVGMQVESELGPEDVNDEMPESALTESTRFSLEDSEGDGLPDDDDDFDDHDDDDELDDGLDGDELEED